MNLLPEIILTTVILICSVLTFLLKDDKQKTIYYISSFGLILALIPFAFLPLIQEGSFLFNSVISNIFTCLFRVLILTGALLTVYLSKKYTSRFGNSLGEFYTLILIATLGAMLLVSANDLIMVFVGIETLSMSSYALCSYTKLDKLSNEAGLKYLIIGAISTAILLYGFSFLYGITGQTNLAEISQYLIRYGISPILIFSFLCILGGFSYKLSAVPFHVWTPDVYQGAPIPVAAYLSVVSKIAGFGILIRFLSMIFINLPIWEISLGIIAVLTMTVGNLMAISQSNIKRLMAYSSIAQAGYILLGLVIATTMGISSMIFYMIVYLFTNFGTWAAIEIYANQTGNDSIDSLSGLAFKQPVLAGSLTVCLLSLAGIPITAGFFSKFYLFQAIIFSGYQFTWLLIIALINTVIAVFYYLKVVKAMFIRPEIQVQETKFILSDSKTLNIVTAFTASMVILLGIFSSSLIDLSKLCALTINLP